MTRYFVARLTADYPTRLGSGFHFKGMHAIFMHPVFLGVSYTHAKNKIWIV